MTRRAKVVRLTERQFFDLINRRCELEIRGAEELDITSISIQYASLEYSIRVESDDFPEVPNELTLPDTHYELIYDNGNIIYGANYEKDVMTH